MGSFSTPSRWFAVIEATGIALSPVTLWHQAHLSGRTG
jgi:hypothetical protein